LLVSFSSFFSSRLPRRPPSPLFPYTTLFRSAATVLAQPDVLGAGGGHEVVLGVGVGAGAAAHHVEPDAGGPGLASGSTWCAAARSEEHTSELQSRRDLVCRLLLEKKKKKKIR